MGGFHKDVLTNNRSPRTILENKYDDLMFEQEVQEKLDADVVEISDDECDEEAVEEEIAEDEEVDAATLSIGQASKAALLWLLQLFPSVYFKFSLRILSVMSQVFSVHV